MARVSSYLQAYGSQEEKKQGWLLYEREQRPLKKKRTNMLRMVTLILAMETGTSNSRASELDSLMVFSAMLLP